MPLKEGVGQCPGPEGWLIWFVLVLVSPLLRRTKPENLVDVKYLDPEGM